jgi:hypothetical protein
LRRCAPQRQGRSKAGGVCGFATQPENDAFRDSVCSEARRCPISVAIRSDRKPTRREALGDGLLLHPLRGPRRSRHNLARDYGPRLLNRAATSSRPIAEDGPLARGNKMHRPYLQNSAVHKPFLSSTSRSSRSRCSAIRWNATRVYPFWRRSAIACEANSCRL